MDETQPRHPDDETVFALVHGLLPGAERERTLDHVRTCADCERLFRDLSRVREKALADGPPAVAASRPDESPSNRRRTRRAWALAAVAAGVAWLLVWFGAAEFGEGGREPAPYWLPTSLEVAVERSADAGVPPGLTTALAAYEQRNVDRAITDFLNLELDGGWADLRDVYLCSALVNAGRYGEAAVVLDRLDVPTLPHDSRMAARWCRYVVLEVAGRDDEARDVLVAMRDDPGPVGERARAELAGRSGRHQGKPMSVNPDQ
ncbi:MAG: hypothetical protein R3D98_11670 [Candidatus Krumholzibacteriia bacterium]